MIIPVILAGGSGTRLWPLSRRLYPKQFIDFLDDQSLFQISIERFNGVDNFADPIVVCSNEHRFIILEQIKKMGTKIQKILLEPVRKNTAPAITAAALYANEHYDDPTLLILPSDHYIERIDLLIDAVVSGRHATENGKLVTFGVTPGGPVTEFGYIQKGTLYRNDQHRNEQEIRAWEVGRFAEKPDAATASEYIQSNEYLWNSGMFLFKTSTFLDEMERFGNKNMVACRQAIDKGTEDGDVFELDAESFDACNNISVDYAVMEKSGNVIVVELNTGWDDLGSWNSFWQVSQKDSDKNVTIGDVVVKNVSDSLIYSSGRLVAALNIKDLAVIETKDVIFVSDLKSASNVKAIVENLENQERTEVNLSSRAYRPWGAFEEIDQDKRFKVKRITVKPGRKLSLQRHYHRSEHWIVVSGTAIVTKGKEEILLKEDESTYIPQGETHRIENPGKINLEIIEVQSGDYLEEDDIERFDDIYGRKKDYGQNPGE